MGALALVGVAALTPSNAEGASATANATVDIVAAIGITKTTDLDHGAVASGASADTVAGRTAGARACGTTLSCTGAIWAASFGVSGGAAVVYTISLPSDATLTNGANTITVGTFAVSKSGLRTLDESGADTFNVGATLNFAVGQASGTYTGTVDVAVESN